MTPDPTSVMVNGVELMVLIFGLVEFLKAVFHLDGDAVTVMSFLVGAIAMIVFLLSEYLPMPYGLFVKWIFSALTVGLAASGYYKFMASRWPRTGE